MRRALVAFSALMVVGFGLAGCGLFKREQREAWRTQAEEACLSQKLVRNTAYMARTSELAGPGTCGITYPFKIAAFAGGTVGLTQRATLACPIIPRTDGWLTEVVQPAAQLYFGVAVAEIRSGSYSCRPQNNRRGARLSEHSFGNAIDVMGFRLADGREVTVLKGWRGTPEEQEFLREVFVGACRYYTTVLGPGADMFHYDHFHLDLARHDPRWQRRVCRPVLKFTPRIEDPAQVAARPTGLSRLWSALTPGTRAPAAPAYQPVETAAGEEEELDAAPAVQEAPARGASPAAPFPGLSRSSADGVRPAPRIGTDVPLY